MKPFKKIYFLFFTFMLATISQVSASELFGIVSYKGQPLANAEIIIKSKKIMTNSKGYYSIELEPGLYTLEIKLASGETRKEKVDVFPQDTEKNLKLE